jgi:hypothetical protein
MIIKTAWHKRPHRRSRHGNKDRIDIVGISIADELKQYLFPRKRTGSIVLARVQTASTNVGIDGCQHGLQTASA